MGFERIGIESLWGVVNSNYTLYFQPKKEGHSLLKPIYTNICHWKDGLKTPCATVEEVQEGDVLYTDYAGYVFEKSYFHCHLMGRDNYRIINLYELMVNAGGRRKRRQNFTSNSSHEMFTAHLISLSEPLAIGPWTLLWSRKAQCKL